MIKSGVHRTRQCVCVTYPGNAKKEYAPSNVRRYDEIIGALTEFAEKCGVPRLCYPERLRQRNMHLDPDFDHLTYGDNGMRRGVKIAKLRPDDLLVF